MASKKAKRDLAVLPFKTQAAFRKWLSANHHQHDGIWIKFARKDSGIKSVTYEESREEALRFGWIDGQIKSVDEQWYLRKFTPRRPRSKWSRINREIVQGLIKANRMEPSGIAEVEAAKKDGRWDAAYSSPAKAKTPPELEALLNRNKNARDFFDSLSSSNRYAFIYRIENAVRQETRAKHIQKAFDMCKKGETYH